MTAVPAIAIVGGATLAAVASLKLVQIASKKKTVRRLRRAREAAKEAVKKNENSF